MFSIAWLVDQWQPALICTITLVKTLITVAYAHWNLSTFVRLFGQRAMYFTRPLGVQTAAFSRLCPSITCECGPIGDAGGVQAAIDLIMRLMSLGAGNLRELMPPLPTTLQLYRTVGTWRITPQATFDFDSRSSSVVFLRPEYRPAELSMFGCRHKSLDKLLLALRIVWKCETSMGVWSRTSF